MATIDKDKVGPALGKVAGGLYIVTVSSGEKHAGFLASWVQQASFDPPMLTLAFSKERGFHHELLKQSGKLVVNIMGKSNSQTMAKFFKKPEDGKDIFDELDTFTGVTNTPILKDSVAYMECEYKKEMEAADHDVILVEVVAGELHNPEMEPSCHYRDNGFHY